MSHSLSKAVEWVLIDRNPVKGQVRKNSISRRDRYIENWELDEISKHSTPFLTTYIVVKLLTGLRRGDLLRLRVSGLPPNRIAVNTSKTGKKLLIEWTTELHKAIDGASAARPKLKSEWVFCTRDGNCYIDRLGNASGFNSLWRRFMARLLKNSNIRTRFQEKDLRKKTASDMPLAAARALLGHTSEATTQRHYRLRGENVQPHSLVNKDNP